MDFVTLALFGALILVLLVANRYRCRIRGHDWEWGLGPCMDCGAANPKDPTRAPSLLAEQHRADIEQAAIVTSGAACWCHTCRPLGVDRMEMVLCPTCGNKRCPHANDHRNDCTGSNEPGQPGSAYP